MFKGRILLLACFFLPTVALASGELLNSWNPKPPGAYSFAQKYPKMARLLYAFDYGHALIYEELWRVAGTGIPSDRLESFIFDPNDDLIVSKIYRILHNPPTQQPNEESLAPRFYTQFGYLVDLFDWGHMLHWFTWDIFTTHPNNDQTRLVNTQMSAYARLPRLSLPRTCKSMNGFMDNFNPAYSRKFRTDYPIANGLIWGYHFVQLRITEALMAPTQGERDRMMDKAYDDFFRYLGDIPYSLPQGMPMAADDAVSPEFWRKYRELGIIFDNLHMVHDVIGDLIVDSNIGDGGYGTREAKVAEMERIIAGALDPNAFIAPDCDDNNHSGNGR